MTGEDGSAPTRRRALSGSRAVALLRHLPDPVIVVDTDANLVWANDTAENGLGWRLDDLAGTRVADLVHPDDLPTALASLRSVRRKEIGTAIDIRVRDGSGTYRTVEVRGRSAVEDPEVGGVVLILRDVADRGRWEVGRGDRALLGAVVDNAPAITMVLEEDGRIRGASRALTRMLGYDLESTLGRRLADLAVEEDRAVVEVALRRVVETGESWSFDALFTPAPAGPAEPVPLGITAVSRLTDQVVRGLVVTATDITPLADARDELTHLATHDHLTGVPNRALMRDRLEHALALARRRRTSVTVLFCDLDHFKTINDTFGHRAGDHVLVEAARRLQRLARGSDTVARLAGDEFVVIVEDDDHDTAPAQLTKRISVAFDEPVRLPTGELVPLTVSIGAVSDDGRSTADAVLHRADSAMYEAKRSRP